MSKKTYILNGIEEVYTKFWYESDKSPEEFDSMEEFMAQADYVHSEGKHGEISYINEDYEVAE